MRERRLSESRRTIEQNVFSRVAALARGRQKNPQIFFHFRLPDIFFPGARPERLIEVAAVPAGVVERRFKRGILLHIGIIFHRHYYTPFKKVCCPFDKNQNPSILGEELKSTL